jgi:galacturonosyltransferase
MKKVLFLVNKDNVVYNFRKELVYALLDRGYDVYISSPYGSKIDMLTARGAKFVPLEIDRRGKNVFKDFKLVWDYYKTISNVKPDIVLTYTTKCSTYGGMVCRFMRIPYIINNAGMYRVEDFSKLIWFVLKTLYRISYSHASCLMYQNTYERDTLNRIISNKAHYRDIPGSGVNLEEFKLTPYPVDDTIIRFNYVARIVKIKGIDELLECAKRIKSKYKNIEFVLYGDFDDDAYRQKVKELEAKGIVKYGGIQLDMKPCISRAHAVIHPSYYEGVTNVILEHGAMGRPAIASDIPGCREGIDEGKSGYLFPLKDVDSLYASVERFILLPHNQKGMMGKMAREKMEREFDRNIVTNIYLEEIKNILSAS